MDFKVGYKLEGEWRANLRYADDIILLATLEAQLHRVDRVSRKYVDKTKILWCSRALCISNLRFVI